ncbi:hypothetical protein HRbin06_00627 [archaeon HR06]|nr:hypothetical protein HRbin06_00627 [archaeon HR06]
MLGVKMDKKAIGISLVTILVLSSLLLLIPLPKVYAQQSLATVTVDKMTLTAGKTYGGAAGATGLVFTITNPATATLAIDYVQIRVPTGWTDPAGKVATTLKKSDGSAVTPQVSGQLIIVTDVFLPPGGSGTITYGTITAGIQVPAKSATGTADVYTFEVFTSVVGSDAIEAVKDNPKVYVTSAVKIGVTSPAAAQAVAVGGTIEITYQIQDAGNNPVAESGVPISVGFKDNQGRLTAQQGSKDYGGSLSASTIWTDSSGNAKVVLTVDTKALITADPNGNKADLAAAGANADGSFTIGGVKYWTWAVVNGIAWVTNAPSPASASQAQSPAIASKPGS